MSSWRRAPFRLPAGEGFTDATLEYLPRVEESEELDQLCHHAGPSRLVARAQPRPVVSVEVLVEQEVIAPVGIGLELLGPTVDGPPTALIAKEQAAQPVRDLLGNLEEVHLVARTGRAFNLEAVAVVQIEAQERPDEHDVDRHPDRPP